MEQDVTAMTHDAMTTLTVSKHLAVLTLNRPQKRNALSADLLEALRRHVEELSSRDDVTACILTGDGPAFCAGMDLKAVVHDAGAVRHMLEVLAEVTIAIRTSPCIFIAQVNGAAIGGGCGLVAVCDVSVTHPDAKLGYPEVDLGVCPAVVAPWLVRKIGAGRARRVLLQGGTMTGQRAGELGLVDHVVPREQLESSVAEIASRIVGAGALALRSTKRALNELDGPELHTMVRHGAHLSADVMQSDEAQQRLARIYGS